MLTIDFVKLQKHRKKSRNVLNGHIPQQSDDYRSPAYGCANELDTVDCLLINDVIYKLPGRHDGTVFVVEWVDRETKTVLNDPDQPYSVITPHTLRHVRDTQTERGIRLYAVVFVTASGLTAFAPGTVINDSNE